MSKKQKLKRRDAPATTNQLITTTTSTISNKTSWITSNTTPLPDISPRDTKPRTRSTRTRVKTLKTAKVSSIKPINTIKTKYKHKQSKSDGDIHIKTQADKNLVGHQRDRSLNINVNSKNNAVQLKPVSAKVTPNKIKPKQRAKSLNGKYLIRTKTYVVLEPLFVKKPRSEDVNRNRKFETTAFFGSKMVDEDRNDLRALDSLFKSLKLSHEKEMSLLATKTHSWRP